MKYDFTQIIDRQGKDSIAVDAPMAKGILKEGFSIIPMWVADMNFATVPTIQEHIIERAKHPAFGYFRPREEYFSSIIDWHSKRFGIEGMTADNIGYENGVLGGVNAALSVITSKGDKVLLHSPTYVGFTGVLKNNGYDMVLSPMKKDENGVWRMDFEDMEQRIKENHIHAAIFCSPHNPTGRVWERWEIEKAMELFKKYDVYVISDEIWADLTLGDNKHIPTQSVSEDARNRVCAMYAPSKTFNLAGLQGAYHVCYNNWWHDRIKKEESLSHYNSMNIMSMHALIGAYKPEGHIWVDELKQVLTQNIDIGYEFFTTKVKGCEVSKPQGTYMLFLDFKEYCLAHNMTIEELYNKGLEVGVIWQPGKPFHLEYGIRMNYALPTSKVEEALERLAKYVFVD